MADATLDFDQLQQALDKLQSMTDAAEAHGTLCGLLMGQHEFSKWLEFTLDKLPDAGDLIAKEQIEGLQSCYEQSKVQLNGEDMGFE